MNREQRYLICYDICEPRRLGRVARYLEKRALRVQYSIFLASLKPSELQILLSDVAQLLDRRMDDLRCYPLARQSRMVTLGRTILPDAVTLVGTM